MIGCDKCEEWYHFECVGLDISQIPDIDNYEFICPECQKKASGSKKTLGNNMNKRNAKAVAKANQKNLEYDDG